MSLTQPARARGYNTANNCIITNFVEYTSSIGRALLVIRVMRTGGIVDFRCALALQPRLEVVDLLLQAVQSLFRLVA